jgi:hypothetical protein
MLAMKYYQSLHDFPRGAAGASATREAITWFV